MVFSYVFISFSSIPCSLLQFWKIDCSFADGFCDCVSLTWVGDGKYVRVGERRQLPNTTSVIKTDTTLRVFPKKKKNCYNIPVGEGKKVVVWVRFYYGNYNVLDKPPSFELMFEGHDWSKVTTSSATAMTFSVIYLTKREKTIVCFRRVEADQDPFVSSISLTMLDPEVYAEVNSSYVLYSPGRFTLGANETIRFPDNHTTVDGIPSTLR